MRISPIWKLLLLAFAPITIWSRPFEIDQLAQSPGPAANADSQEIAHLLAQPYRYFGDGGQSFVCFSADGKYVLKFFKRLDTNRHKQAQKWRRVVQSFQLAQERLAPESGLLYVHFQATQDLPQAFVVDVQAAPMTLDLNKWDFVLQRRAVPTSEYLQALKAQGDLEGAKLALKQLFDLSAQLYTKGVRNRDANFKSNTGFLDGKPLLIDVGRLTLCPKGGTKALHRKEVRRISQKFRSWLETNYPELSPYFDELVEEILKKA